MSSFIKVLIAVLAFTSAASPAADIVPRPVQPMRSVAGGVRSFPAVQKSVQPGPRPALDTTMAFGATVVALLIFCRAHHYLKSWIPVGTFLFGLAAACYGCIAGAWPLGLAVGAYSIATLCNWVKLRGRKPTRAAGNERISARTDLWKEFRPTWTFGMN